jgi:hypothetical protein
MHISFFLFWQGIYSDFSAPRKPLQDSSERSREQTHRWEEVLKDSASARLSSFFFWFHRDLMHHTIFGSG